MREFIQSRHRLFACWIPLTIIWMNLIWMIPRYKWSLIFMIIMTQLFIYSLILGLCLSIYEKIQEWRERRRRERPQRVLTSLEKNLNKHPIICVKDECMICLDPLDYAIKLECNHIYHRHCIDRMIEYQIHLCPLCRAEMV